VLVNNNNNNDYARASWDTSHMMLERLSASRTRDEMDVYSTFGQVTAELRQYNTLLAPKHFVAYAQNPLSNLSRVL
jgi:hypothetical protein